MTPQQKLQCCMCDEDLSGRFKVQDRGYYFCATCYDALPLCKTCKRVILPGEDALEGLCDECYVTILHNGKEPRPNRPRPNRDLWDHLTEES